MFLALASGQTPDVDLTRWHALQTWLAAGAADVVIPFGRTLARLVPPVATRLRRDFSTVLALIKAHALLHQASRERDDEGRVVATVADYAVIRELVSDLIAAEVETTVSPAVRAVVEAVKAVAAAKPHDVVGEPLPVSQADLCKHLQLDKAAVSRRVAEAVTHGFLDDLARGQKGRPSRIVLAEPMPDEDPLLPDADTVLREWRRGRGEGGNHRPETPPTNQLFAGTGK